MSTRKKEFVHTMFMTVSFPLAGFNTGTSSPGLKPRYERYETKQKIGHKKELSMIYFMSLVHNVLAH